MAFWFDTLGTDFVFAGGQFADFTLLDPPYTDAEGNTRSFSIASSPETKDTVMIATRMRDTAFKNSLKTIPLGTKVRVNGPMGDFTLHKNTEKPVVFLAGGIGITPLYSMLRWALEKKLPYKMTLFYSNPTPQATAFLGELGELKKTNKNFKFIPTVTDSEDISWKYQFGRINEEMLRKFIPNISSPMYYVAGPPAMVAAMRDMLERVGADSDNVRSEEFGGY